MIQRAANSLIDRGLIETVRNPDHERAHRLVSTAAGIALKAELDRAGLDRAEALTAGMDAQAIEQAVGALRKIRESLETNMRREGGR